MVALVAAASVLASCSANPAGDTSGGDASEDAPAAGVTDDEITLSFLAADLSTLSDQGLAPDIGNPEATAKAVVDEINSSGGVNGRKIVLKTHILDGVAAISDPTTTQTDCIAATEEDEPLAVIVGPALPSDLLRCTAVTHPFITLAMNQWTDELYGEAEGRLFSCCSNNSISTNRVYRAWPGILIDGGALEAGDKVGIISQQPGGIGSDQTQAIDDDLVPALEDAGIEVAVRAELPCPEKSPSCAQHAAALQKMKDADVDAVFLLAANLAGSATVAAARDLDYHPTWTTAGDNTTSVVSNFFASVKDVWDGAWGISMDFDPPSAEADACNEIAQKVGVEFDRSSGGYAFTAMTCLQIQLLADAIGTVDGTITQAKVIDALESMDDVPSTAGPNGSFGPDKHDAGNAVFLARFDAEKGYFVPVGGEIEAIEVP